jgi:cysteine synthase
LARFRNEVVLIGTLESTIEGIGVSLVALAKDLEQRIVFIVTEGYRTKFGIPEQTVVEELACLRTFGALVMSVKEVLQSSEPLEVVWTVPAKQEDPSDPQAVESLRPGCTVA